MTKYEHRIFRLPPNVDEKGIEFFFDGLNLAGWELVWNIGTFTKPDGDVALLFRRRISLLSQLIDSLRKYAPCNTSAS